MRSLREYRSFEEDFKNLSNGVLANMKGFLELDFSCYNPLNYSRNLSMIFRNSNDESLELQPFSMLGSGQKKIMMFLLSYCFAKNFRMQENLILLIDEPESNLHPVAQKWFAKKLYEFSREGLQIVISTHSPYFINLDYIDSIYLVKKNENGTYVVKNDAYSLSEHCKNRGASKSDQSNVIEFYSVSSTPSILQGFFAKLVILVEGSTEEMALPVYFNKVGLDLLQQGIEIISVSGKLQIPKWVRLFSAYKIPCYAFFDYDYKKNSKQNNSQKRYQEEARDILVSLGYNTEDIEKIINELNNTSINGKNCSPITRRDKFCIFHYDFVTIGDKFCVFHDDFEEAMKGIFGNSYEEEENKVKEKYCLGDRQKHLVAREVAKRIVESIENNHIENNHLAIEIFKKIYEQLTRLIEQSGG
ncbi:MAG: AAA family ATPase [Candidatus Calescibacterium sp.]|nr:AAA family ATPase [Candidatus Calescibacterium sp.]MDW8195919.1 AAA family ATPase [Candidatus Calescibacterium sp.]